MATFTFTYGTTPIDVIEDALPHKYPMELNRTDMITILSALLLVTEVDDSGIDQEIIENAGSLRSSILSTIDIEEV